jgi:hypothetical protein
MIPLETELTLFDEAKGLYDKFLFEAYGQVDASGKPISEEKAKLAARIKLRNATGADLEVLRWKLRARLGVPREE